MAREVILMEGMAGISRDEILRRLTNAYGPRAIQLPINDPRIVRDEAPGELVYGLTAKIAADAVQPAAQEPVTIDAVIQAWANE